MLRTDAESHCRARDVDSTLLLVLCKRACYCCVLGQSLVHERLEVGLRVFAEFSCDFLLH